MLTPEELNHFSARLEAALDEVRRALELAAANDMGTVILDQSGVGRLSRMDALQQQAMAAGWNETRLRENRPFCTDCQAEIEEERSRRASAMDEPASPTVGALSGRRP